MRFFVVVVFGCTLALNCVEAKAAISESGESIEELLSTYRASECASERRLAKRKASLAQAVAIFSGLRGQSDRLRTAMSENDFDVFMLHRAEGFCADKNILSRERGTHVKYDDYRREVFADTFGAIQAFRHGVSIHILREISDLRAASVVFNSQFANQTAYHCLEWFNYYTSPAIDAVIDAISRRSHGDLKLLQQDDVYRLAMEISDKTSMSNKEFVAFRYEMQSASLASGRVLYPEALPWVWSAP